MPFSRKLIRTLRCPQHAPDFYAAKPRGLISMDKIGCRSLLNSELTRMAVVWTSTGTFRAEAFKSEADLESSIFEIRAELFGRNRIYLDIKKKIGAKGGLRNIPDGYVLDLTATRPRLFVVENELAAHDPLRHIAVQILQFSLSFEAEPIAVKRILLELVNQDGEIRKTCEAYAVAHGYRNLDHLFEWLVFESPFAALVIIDAVPENLENVLAKKFQFGVEVLEISRFRNSQGETVYLFEPFLADILPVEEEAGPGIQSPVAPPSAEEIDTLVVPARPEGFRDLFLGENRWYAVRIHGSMRPQIKYIAGYQVAPVSAITHIASVKSIEPWKDSGKFVVNFAEPAKEIGPIPLNRNGRVRNFQNLRYTSRAKLDSANSLDDIW